MPASHRAHVAQGAHVPYETKVRVRLRPNDGAQPPRAPKGSRALAHRRLERGVIPPTVQACFVTLPRGQGPATPADERKAPNPAQV